MRGPQTLLPEAKHCCCSCLEDRDWVESSSQGQNAQQIQFHSQREQAALRVGTGPLHNWVFLYIPILWTWLGLSFLPIPVSLISLASAPCAICKGRVLIHLCMGAYIDPLIALGQGASSAWITSNLEEPWCLWMFLLLDCRPPVFSDY